MKKAGSCCDKTRNADEAREAIRKGYKDIAEGSGSCCGTGKGTCVSSSPDGMAKAVGYSDAELATLPEGANMGLSCGNPTAIAALKPGEVVVDLGSGGGFDVFIAAQKVGSKGRVIGVDMTPEMISKARGNVPEFSKRTGLKNVEFRLGEIEHLPVADNSADVIISNCVINLSPDKPQVWRDMFRVLKAGGRVAVSDLALMKPLPLEVLESVVALVGCVAGAVLVEDTRAMAKAAGFTDIALTPNKDYIKSMEDWKDQWYGRIIKTLPAGEKLSDYVVSLSVEARKRVR